MKTQMSFVGTDSMWETEVKQRFQSSEDAAVYVGQKAVH